MKPLDLIVMDVRDRRLARFFFSAIAVEWLGMPVDAMPFYSSSALIRWKGRRILGFVMETGNFGHNRDMSYYNRYPYLIRKAISLWRHTWDFLRQLMIFPLDALRVWALMIKEGVSAVRKGSKYLGRRCR